MRTTSLIDPTNINHKVPQTEEYIKNQNDFSHYKDPYFEKLQSQQESAAALFDSEDEGYQDIEQTTPINIVEEIPVKPMLKMSNSIIPPIHEESNAPILNDLQPPPVIDSHSESLDDETTKSHLSPDQPMTFFTENIQQISAIFDKQMFSKINSVEHIIKTEQELEDMKNTIKDKKRLQKERNVLTA